MCSVQRWMEGVDVPNCRLSGCLCIWFLLALHMRCAVGQGLSCTELGEVRDCSISHAEPSYISLSVALSACACVSQCVSPCRCVCVCVRGKSRVFMPINASLKD